MEDLQSAADHRNIPLEKVGVTKLALPIMILEQDGGYQHVVASASMFVGVAAKVRGTHLSRFVEVLHEWADKPVSSTDIERLLATVMSRSNSRTAEIQLSFRYFLAKTAPISGKVGVIDYECEFSGRLSAESFRFQLGVSVPITTLCPCSKMISEYGAHNQRATATVRLECEPGVFVWLEDLIRLVEDQGSCPLFSVLKREDEKWVTERSYDNPKFVEDVTRDIALNLAKMSGIRRFAARTESIESIHNHNAVAAIGWVEASSGSHQEESQSPAFVS
jgi:GTP cyclohydrolase I